MLTQGTSNSADTSHGHVFWFQASRLLAAAACASDEPTPRTAQMHLPLTTALATGDALRHYRRLLDASRRSGP